MKNQSPLLNLPKPANVHLERVVIGTLLRRNGLVDLVNEIISYKVFFDPACREIYAVMSEVLSSGKEIDEHIIVHRLNNDEKRVLRQCMEAQIDGANIVAHARELRDLYTRREAMAAAFDALTLANRPDVPINELIERIQDRFDGVYDDGDIEDGDEQANDIAQRVVTLAQEASLDESAPGFPSGVANLDQILKPMRPGNFVIIGGRPGQGKTALAMNIVEHLTKATRNKDNKWAGPAAILSLEMPKEELVERSLAGEFGVQSSSIADGTVCNTGDVFERMCKYAMDLHDVPLYIQSPNHLSAKNLYTTCKRLVRKRKVKVVVIDYIQLMDGDENKSPNEKIGAISKACKKTAKKLGIVIIGLSQLSRRIEDREDKTPVPSDLRDSGSLEQDADVIIFCYRPITYIRAEEPPQNSPNYPVWQQKLNAAGDTAFLTIVKQRRGRTGKAEVRFDETRTRFH